MERPTRRTPIPPSQNESALSDLAKAKARLVSPITCVLVKGDRIAVSERRGVAPLLAFYEEGGYAGYAAADRIVGKAAAFLYVLLGVRAVFAEVVSEPAREVLLGHGIALEALETVPRIQNRAGDGLCPMESAVVQLTDPEEAYRAILEARKALSARNPS